MRKIIVYFTLLLFLCGCSNNSESNNIKTIQTKIEDAGYIIGEINEFDGITVFDISTAQSSFMFTLIDEQLEFTSYHKQSINTYITYLNAKETYLGEVYRDEKNYCSYSFQDNTTSTQCTETEITDIKQLKADLEQTLKTMDISINELADWAIWYSKQ